MFQKPIMKLSLILTVPPNLLISLSSSINSISSGLLINLENESKSRSEINLKQSASNFSTQYHTFISYSMVLRINKTITFKG